jgi:DNA repair protein RadC
MAITDWPVDERPRERLMAHGAAALSDAELLALFLRVGIKGKTAVDLARDCLAQFGGLARLFAASASDFGEIHGMGPAKYVQLQAVIELARRAIGESLVQAPVLNSPQVVQDYLRLRIGHLQAEAFTVLFLDSQHRLLACEEMFHGTLTQTAVYPREVVKRALALNAGAVILAHNHPSGVAEPSHADRMLTTAMQNALGLVDVKVLDHFVVAGRQVLSFAQQGLM